MMFDVARHAAKPPLSWLRSISTSALEAAELWVAAIRRGANLARGPSIRNGATAADRTSGRCASTHERRGIGCKLTVPAR